MEKPEDARTAREHLVRFYDTDDELVNTVVPFLAAGLDSDESVLVIATEHHKLAFERELALMDIGLERAIAAGTFFAVDATQTLDLLQKDGSGEIGADDFAAIVGQLVRRQLESGRGLRVYGEVVALLWDRGEASAAVALEAMWNELQRQHPFTLFCGYPVASAPEQLEAVEQVCRAHSFVLPATTVDPQSDASPVDEQFAADIQAPRRVRALLRSALGDLQFGEELIERLILAASELSANAVVHAHTPFRLVVQPRAASVWLAVEDRAPLRSPLDVIGRTPHGLGLIAALAVRWGVTPCPAGKIVWAEIPR